MSREAHRQIESTKTELEQTYDAMLNACNRRVTADLVAKAQRLNQELQQLRNGASAIGVLNDQCRVD